MAKGKPTLATLKSFIKKNKDRLLFRGESAFDGMYDCVMPTREQSFHRAHEAPFTKHTFGIHGIWLVDGPGRNSITPYDKDGVQGYRVYNSCGSFIVGVTFLDACYAK